VPLCLKDRFSNFVAVILNYAKTINDSGYYAGSYIVFIIWKTV